MKKFFYLNGKIQDINKPAVQINDIGILRGYGVFDFFRTHHGKLFHFDDHFKRFANSARVFGLRLPVSRAQMEKIILSLLKKNKVKDASFRPILTGGPSEDGLSYKKPNFAILTEDIYTYPKSYYDKGIKVITCEYLRVLPETKNSNYILALKMVSARKKKGAVEILYTNQGKVLEASTANFFIFKGATLITAKHDILKGITRKVVLKLARGKFKVEEREVKLSDLDSAAEAFITGGNKLIMPVVNIDGKKIGHGGVGENTKWLMSEFKKYTEKNK